VKAYCEFKSFIKSVWRVIFRYWLRKTKSKPDGVDLTKDRNFTPLGNKFLPDIAVYTSSPSAGALRQGEILTNLMQICLAPDSIEQSEPLVNPINHPFVIILTQDCDLDWDHRARNGASPEDKLIPNILFCEMTTAESLKGRADIKSDFWKRIRINKDERYQFLQKVDPGQDALGQGLPELGIDFKRYFTIPTEEVYHRLRMAETKRRCRLISPYLEHLSTRFCYFQFRVALPEEHFSEPLASIRSLSGASSGRNELA
jgi:hypothetical protein